MSGPRRRMLVVLDALRGCEGRRITREELNSFYANEYLKKNPTLDAEDADAKAGAILHVYNVAALPRPRTVLDVGCGSGAVLTRVQQGLDASFGIGIDYGLPQARIAAVSNRHGVVWAEGESLPLRSSSVDFAYATDVLEHVRDPAALLRELGRVATLVGLFVPIEAGLLATPLYAYRRALGKPTNREQYGHIWRWFRPEIIALCRKARLAPIATSTYRPPPRAHASTSRGRAIETLHAIVEKCSPRTSELLFGGVAAVGVYRAIP